ncbi:MAG: PAS domain-containing protein [Terriglobales bacterium]|jgi:PAS domain S-box-containing protein
MSSSFFDNPGFIRTVLEELPVGIYLVDRDRRIRFWNRGAEQIVGHLAQEVVGRACTEHIFEAGDAHGQVPAHDATPVTLTLHDGQPRQARAHLLHKEGHRVAVTMRCRAIAGSGDAIEGAIVLFDLVAEPSGAASEESAFGFLDPTMGIPAHRLTQTVLRESMEAMEESKHGFGLLRIRVLGLDEFRSKHGPHSVVPFLRTTAHTLRHTLDPASFLGRWGEDEFIAVLPSSNPVATATAAEMVWNLLTSSEVRWWGDRFPIQAVVMHTVARPGDKLEKLLNGLEPTHAAATGRAIGMAHGSAQAASNRG